jgi:NAD(P)-dependent dehydrogenase (short-subunit alcohol dehydrogenase family)
VVAGQQRQAARRELGDRALILRADAGNVAEQAALARAVGEAFGGLDALFINAGVGDFRPIEQWDEAGFDRTLAINLKGP